MLRESLSSVCGWKECTASDYANIYMLYGGSSNTHPEIVDFINSQSRHKLRYFAKQEHGEKVAAIFTNDKMDLCPPPSTSSHQHVNFDETIFPAKPSSRFILPFKSKIISDVNKENIINLLPNVFNKRTVCLVKDNFCSKTQKNRRNEIHGFQRSGGEIRSIKDFTPDEICNIYKKLFAMRWGKSFRDDYFNSLKSFSNRFQKMLFGHVLLIDNQPCAIDYIVKTDSPEWLYFDVVNGGLDPKYKDLSLGSILMWLNIQEAKTVAQAAQKAMRVNLGKPSMEYKKRWTHCHTLYRTL